MTLRVLRVGNSNDLAGKLPDEARAWKIAADMFAAATGEPVETILKRAWPNEAFPGIVEGWMNEYRPDLVVLQVNNFWYGHASTPLWLERRFGRAGKAVGGTGLAISRKKWFVEGRVSVLASRALLRVLPSATFFPVEEVGERMEQAMRKVLAHEGVVLLVRGNERWAKLPMSTKRVNDRNLRLNEAMSSTMRTICDRLRVPYFQRPLVEEHELRDFLDDARWHNGEKGERVIGEYDGQAMIDAWKATRV
ncbi:MAG: hypothetical protein AB7N24_02515 [Dehalococcoidia bacterium]